MNFGKNIKKIRIIKKMSQTSFADIFGITRSSIGAYEEGRAEPKLEVIIKIANYFSISVDDLVNSEITVNDISKKQVYDKFFREHNPLITTNIDNLVDEVPLIECSQLINKSIHEVLKKSSRSIHIPNLHNENCTVCLQIQSGISFSKPFQANDLIVINKNSSTLIIENYQNRYWLLQKRHKILIGEISLITEKQYLFYSGNGLPIKIEKDDFKNLFLIEKIIQQNPLVVDNAKQKLKNLEQIVNYLYNKIE